MSSPLRHDNHLSTTAIYATFTYSGGETFTFEGDDDVCAVPQ